jgi:hypothetical protein
LNTPAAEAAAVFSHSPPSNTLSPRSEVSPSPSNWTLAQEQLAQEEYDNELAEHYLYELVRRFARAARALSHYDCQVCLEELEQLPHVHQHSSMVIAMVGRAHYERQDYPSVRRFNITAAATWILLIIDISRLTVHSKLYGRRTLIACGIWRFTLPFCGNYSRVSSFRF